MHRGATLIEIMLTVALFAFLVGLGLFMSMEAYRGATHRSERDVIVSLLAKARSRAMANIDESAWSVCYDAGEYLIAKGAACPSGARERVEANEGVVSASDLDDFPVIFQPVTGVVLDAPRALVVVQGGRDDETITINYEGTILW